MASDVLNPKICKFIFTPKLPITVPMAGGESAVSFCEVEEATGCGFGPACGGQWPAADGARFVIWTAHGVGEGRMIVCHTSEQQARRLGQLRSIREPNASEGRQATADSRMPRSAVTLCGPVHAWCT